MNIAQLRNYGRMFFVMTDNNSSTSNGFERKADSSHDLCTAPLLYIAENKTIGICRVSLCDFSCWHKIRPSCLGSVTYNKISLGSYSFTCWSRLSPLLKVFVSYPSCAIMYSTMLRMSASSSTINTFFIIPDKCGMKIWLYRSVKQAQVKIHTADHLIRNENNKK